LISFVEIHPPHRNYDLNALSTLENRGVLLQAGFAEQRYAVQVSDTRDDDQGTEAGK
jgi:hypothetical protein